MKEKILIRIKSIMIFILGMIVSGVSVYKAAGKLYASSIDVDTSKMSELGETSNVNLALNYLYGKASTIANATEDSRFHYYAEPTYIAFIYLDPTDLTKKCTRNDIDNSTGTKEGCMKWYIYKEDSNKYYAILDHNTTAAVSSWLNASNQIVSDAVNWGIKDNIDLNPRLITKDEISAITWFGFSEDYNAVYFDGPNQKNNSWQSPTTGSRGSSDFSWLYDHLGNCPGSGCISSSYPMNTWGYWTASSSSSDSTKAWIVFYSGCLFKVTINYTGYNVGVRPVIEIPKTLFN